MRGENFSVFVFVAGGSGSSPHARGKRSEWSMTTSEWVAHPRMRGENRPKGAAVLRVEGSSPHARGKLYPCVCRVPRGRLIPACAGKTNHLPQPRKRPRAHPRMRGENNSKAVFTAFTEGSSPHARGKLAAWIRDNESKRLIPACAGKTRKQPALKPQEGAHPRMRGENQNLPLMRL